MSRVATVVVDRNAVTGHACNTAVRCAPMQLGNGQDLKFALP